MSEYLSFKLPEAFISEYENRRPNWGFPIGGGNFLSEIVYVDKYSALKPDGSKEQWHETVRRCIEGMYSILKDHCRKNKTPWNEYKALQSAKDAYDRMWNFKWLPPGRGLQHMGRDIVHKDGVSNVLQNCFSGDTKVLTLEYGSVQLVDVVGETVKVVGAAGVPTLAEVKHFGAQAVQQVELKPWGVRTNIRRMVTVTPDHRWILADGVETTSLAVGDRIAGCVNSETDHSTDEYWDGFLHGMVFADGNEITHKYVNGDFGYELRACGQKKQEMAQHERLLQRWGKVNWDRPSCNGDPVFSIRSPKNLKSLPDLVDPDYLKGFIEAWVSCDGTPSSSSYGSVKLDTICSTAFDWLSENAPLAGYTVIGHNVVLSDSNYGPRRPLHRFTLAFGAFDWKVQSISKLDEDVEVFCAVVPEGAAFTLSYGVLTGNCSFLSTGKISTHSAWEATGPFERMMEMSMNGIGVGFDTRGAGSLILHQPSTERFVEHVVEDSREGWARSISVLLETFFFKNRASVSFDYSLVRPAGSLLKTFGGRASGPEPLKFTHDKIVEILSSREGELITSRDIVDIMNLIGKAVVAGGSRRCLPSGSIVKTTRGPIAIEKVLVGDFVDTPAGVKKVTNVFYQGPQKTVLVNHAFGQFECTPNHRLAVWDSYDSWVFKEAGELSSKDRLVWDFLPVVGKPQKTPDCKMNREFEGSYVRNSGRIPVRARWDGVDCELDGCKRSAVVKNSPYGAMCNAHYLRWKKHGHPLEFRGWAKNVVLPEYVTEDFAWLVGLIQGDGTNSGSTPSKGSVNIACSEEYPEIIDKAVRILSELCPDTKIALRSGDGRCIVISVANARFANWTADFVKTPNTDMGVPEWIFKNTPEIRGAYLAGLFDADGSSSGRGFRLASTVYSGFAAELVKLCVSLGFSPKVCQVDRSSMGWKTLFNLDVVGCEFKQIAHGWLVDHASSKIMGVSPGRKSGKGMLSFLPGQAVSAGVGKTRANVNSSVGVKALIDITGVSLRAYPVPVVSVVPGRVSETWDIEVDEIHQFTVNGFVSHNSAQISFGDTNDYDYVSIKDWNLEENEERCGPEGWSWLSNNSVFVDEQYPSDIIEKVKINGEPGFMWLDLARDYGRMVDPPDYRDHRVLGANPCFSGDTLIGVADGRSAVTLAELAETGDDVAVYSLNPGSGRIEIKMARAPRKTRSNAKLVEILLNDGTTLRVTPDHKMITLDGEVKQAGELVKGDRLPAFNKRLAEVKKGGKQYIRVGTDIHDGRVGVFEHRLIARFNDPERWDELYDNAKASGWIKGGIVVHHKDYNPLNNAPENLEIMTHGDHKTLHGSIDNFGEDNPMYGRSHSESTKRLIGEKTKERFSSPEYRERHVGAVRDGMTDDVKNRISEKRKESWKEYYVHQESLTDLKTVWVGENLYAVKPCKTCGTEMTLEWRNRAHVFCSHSCSNADAAVTAAQVKGLKAAHAARSEKTLQKQIEAFLGLQAELGRDPLRKEWQAECRKQGVSFRFQANTHNPNIPSSFGDLKNRAALVNHRVLGVREVDGLHDVYNLTVDDFNTVAVVTKIAETGAISGIITPQCNEQSLEDQELCTLCECFPAKHDNFADFRQTLKHAYLYGKAVTLLPTSWPESNEVMARNRRIGCSLSGLAEFVETRGWGELRSWMDQGYDFIEHRDKKYSEWLAVRESIKKTSIKPSGTVSILAATTPGVHWPISSGSHIRRVRYSKNDPKVEILANAGYEVEPMFGDSNTVVVKFVTEFPEMRNQREVSIWEKTELACLAQRYWADNQVSVTVSFLPSEADQLLPLLQAKTGQLKGVSFLPLSDDIVYQQAPYEDIDEAAALLYNESKEQIENLYGLVNEASGDKFCDSDVCLI